ncbi:hypothetical protein GQ600_3426 [Phytophthora cactorum]|nr:hypothetical protein GQ600_3426 [Phytophthora cactorum]
MKRLIVTDSFYATVSLSLKLLDIGLCHVGTTRMEWCPTQFTCKRRPKKIPRGTYRIAQARGHPQLVALSLLDSKPVNMLAPGCSNETYQRSAYGEGRIAQYSALSTHPNAEDLVTVPIPHQEHLPNSFYTTSKQHKRRQHLCKVCSPFSDLKTKSFETSFYCSQCSDAFGGRLPLCCQARRLESGNTQTCSEICARRGETTKTFQQAKKKIRFRNGREVARKSNKRTS